MSVFPKFTTRKFSIVIHNVYQSIKPFIEDFLITQNSKRYVVSVEPYPDQDGFHAHIFLEFRQVKKCGIFFSWHKKYFDKLVCPKPEGVEGSWGRIQVDAMRGSFEDAVKYLTDPDKDKPLGEDVKLVDVSRQIQLDEYFWSNDQMVSLFMSQFTGEYVTGRTIIKEYQSRDLPLPPHWKTVQTFWERGPPTSTS